MTNRNMADSAADAASMDAGTGKMAEDNVCRHNPKSVKGDIRCCKCNRLLMKGKVEYVEVKCPRCGSMQIFESDNKN